MKHINSGKVYIESQEKHNSSGFCPKNKSAQTQNLYALYGHQKNVAGSGLPAWMVNQPRVQYLRGLRVCPKNKPMLTVSVSSTCPNYIL